MVLHRYPCIHDWFHSKGAFWAQTHTNKQNPSKGESKVLEEKRERYRQCLLLKSSEGLDL